jgi:methylmalonyl-CoA mutase
VARRRMPLTGTSEFPDIGEAPVAVLDRPAPQAALPAAAAVTAQAMPARRLSEPFEALRDTGEAHRVATGARPRIFLANLGRIADFNTRSTWARNLFEAGGIEAVTNDGFAGLDDLVAAYRAAGTPVACLCSSDAVYAAEAVAAAAALAGAGARHVVLAGKPADAEAEAAYRAAGIQGFVHAGQDVVATLGDLQQRLGVAAAGPKG